MQRIKRTMQNVTQYLKCIALSGLMTLALPLYAQTSNHDPSFKEELEALKEELKSLKKELAELKANPPKQKEASSASMNTASKTNSNQRPLPTGKNVQDQETLKLKKLEHLAHHYKTCRIEDAKVVAEQQKQDPPPPIKKTLSQYASKSTVQPENLNASSNQTAAERNNFLFALHQALAWGGQDISTLITGEASVGFMKQAGEHSSFNTVDFNPILLATYKDFFFLRAALDFTLDDDGNTQSSLDFANLNWVLSDYAVFGAGKVDSNLGQFVQNLSPDWINRLASPPPGFDGDQAAPQSDIGIYIRGGFPLFFHMNANYAVYTANGPRGYVDLTNNLVDHIGTDGYPNGFGNYVAGGRFGLLPIPQLEIGVSGAIGKLALIDLADETTLLQRGRGYNVLGADFNFQWRNWNFRGEIIQQKMVSQIYNILTPYAESWNAWYLQAAYRIPSSRLEPVLRFGKFKTPFSEQNQQQWVFGLDYWFAPSIVGKIAYQLNQGQMGTLNNANAFLLQIAFGF